MFTKVKPFLLYGVSPVHAGSGSELGIVDLPIQRERYTGYPKIESSSLKGAIRAVVESGQASEEKTTITFGSKLDSRQDGKSVAGAIGFSDARILLFPVRSLRGVFAFITCPGVIKRFNQELETYLPEVELLPVPEENTMSTDELQVGSRSEIVLEEYTYPTQVDPITEELAKKLDNILFNTDSTEGRLAKRLVVLSNDDFGDFVQHSTEVVARIKIGSEGVVDAEEGALWYEENLPAETVLYSFLFVGEPRKENPEGLNDVKEVLKFITDDEVFPPVFQLGGNHTLGQGMLRRVWFQREAE